MNICVILQHKISSRYRLTLQEEVKELIDILEFVLQRLSS